MKKAFVLILLLAVSANLFGQTTTLTTQQKQALQDALTRIATANAIVPNMVYNGMTFNEIQTLFSKQKLSIEPKYSKDYYVKNYGDAYKAQCRVGNYIIFFSSFLEYNNPVVIGFAKYGDPKIWANSL